MKKVDLLLFQNNSNQFIITRPFAFTKFNYIQSSKLYYSLLLFNKILIPEYKKYNAYIVI